MTCESKILLLLLLLLTTVLLLLLRLISLASSLPLLSTMMLEGPKSSFSPKPKVSSTFQKTLAANHTGSLSLHARQFLVFLHGTTIPAVPR
jgi:hypothetical protein